MKTSLTTFAALAALALAAPALAQGNAFFNYENNLPSRAERQHLEQVAQRDRASQQPYALTGKSARAEQTPTQRAVQAPGNGFTPVELPTR